MSENTATNGRDWFKIATLALAPTFVAGLLFLAFQGGSPQAGAETIPETTTSTTLDSSTTSEALGSAADEQDPPPEDEAPEALEPDEENETGADAGQEEEQEPEAPPTDAALSLPAEVAVDGEGQATIEISNLGELPLEIYLVDVNGHPIEVGETPMEVAGNSTEGIPVTVDTSGLPFGEYVMTVSISTNDGVGHVDVKGAKFFVILPLIPDVDVSPAYVVPHQVNAVNVTITNNEPYTVTVALSSEDDRLSFPDEVELEPGPNQVFVGIQALAVPSNVIDILQLNVSWSGTEMGTVTITKHGS